MEITILGCGNSHGVPYINCHCFVCTSPEQKNKRTRPSILISNNGTNILIDTSPDLREQCIRNNITTIDSIIYTHSHYDHVSGINDIRRMCKDSTTIDAYIDTQTFKNINTQYSYIFNSTSTLYPPLLKRIQLKKYQQISNINVMSFEQRHGTMISQGIRLGNVAYSTDFNMIPEKSFDYLQALDVWIIDCMKYSYNLTHSYFEKTLLLIEKVKPKLSILTHMGHEIEYKEISKLLPQNIIAAYDGLKINTA